MHRKLISLTCRLEVSVACNKHAHDGKQGCGRSEGILKHQTDTTLTGLARCHTSTRPSRPATAVTTLLLAAPAAGAGPGLIALLAALHLVPLQGDAASLAAQLPLPASAASSLLPPLRMLPSCPAPCHPARSACHHWPATHPPRHHAPPPPPRCFVRCGVARCAAHAVPRPALPCLALRYATLRCAVLCAPAA